MMSDENTDSRCPAACAVTEVVAMVHVSDVERSVAFYAQLGFECESRFSNADRQTNWASVRSGTARLFFARASGPIPAQDQAVLFYMYSDHVGELRAHLLQHGLRDAGAPPGEGPFPELEYASEGYVFQIVPRFYMPLGELRVHDPDGYCILIGQIG
jgi:catechol 2,3-dioxygenase-like lactoylglutathione lyase family enzyme